MKTIRIGTRNSPLAMWQALEVEQKLQQAGFPTQIIPITSHGDKDLKQPLYQMNIVGVFTKDLDIALLNNEIDIAVHSLKDVPTEFPEGIVLSAVLKRDYEQDVLIRNPKKKHTGQLDHLYIGTGSLRRRAFWKLAYPDVTFDNIRGNVQKRLENIEKQGLDGTIFSLAGIKRLKLPLPYEMLDFIIPAPGQGIVAVTSLNDNQELLHTLGNINHKETEICASVERIFLNKLEGGCTAPIGAVAEIKDNQILFRGGVVSLDGKEKVLLSERFPINEFQKKTEELTRKAINLGAGKIIKEIKIRG